MSSGAELCFLVVVIIYECWNEWGGVGRSRKKKENEDHLLRVEETQHQLGSVETFFYSSTCTSVEKKKLPRTRFS